MDLRPRKHGLQGDNIQMESPSVCVCVCVYVCVYVCVCVCVCVSV
jgi:hypothetical protein